MSKDSVALKDFRGAGNLPPTYITGNLTTLVHCLVTGLYNKQQKLSGTWHPRAGTKGARRFPRESGGD